MGDIRREDPMMLARKALQCLRRTGEHPEPSLRHFQVFGRGLAPEGAEEPQSVKCLTSIVAGPVNSALRPLDLRVPPFMKPSSAKDRRFHFTVEYGMPVRRETTSARAVMVSS